MNIKILWTSCQKCKFLYTTLQEALKKSWLNAKIEKVEDIEEILAYNIMSTPGLVIDEKIVSIGIVPDIDELIIILKSANTINQTHTGGCCGEGNCCG